jgi:hypothetical protein
MSVLTDLQKYYANLLINQYFGKDKARSTIELYVKVLIPINEDTGNLLILDVQEAFNVNTAVGVQLDILDKYIGLESRGGLSDDDYRFLLKLKIIQNHIDHTFKSINDALYAFFGTDVYMVTDGNMALTYYVPESTSIIIDAILRKKLLPVPIGVDCQAVLVASAGYFGFTSYSPGVLPVNGFTDYSDVDKSGAFLSYDDILVLGS